MTNLQEAQGEIQALRDMLDSARSELDLLREALRVPVEPHQNLLERMLVAASAAADSRRNTVALVQRVADDIVRPEALTDLQWEYFKAGIRHFLTELNMAIAPQKPPL